MRRLLPLIAVLVVLPTLVGPQLAAGPGKDILPPKEKWQVKGINHAGGTDIDWELKLHAVKLKGATVASVTLEFVRDVTDVKLDNFRYHLGLKAWHFHFYEDKISVKCTNDYTVVGNVTGQKGDRIRLDVRLPEVDWKTIDEVKVIYEPKK